MLELVMEVSLDHYCDVCGADLPNNNVYCFSQCRQECEEQHGNYDLCHACTDSSAQVDWTSPVVMGSVFTQGCWGGMRGCAGDVADHLTEEMNSEEYWDELSVFSPMKSFARTALSLNLPTTDPYLLTPKEWIARNAPNIWRLSCGPFRIAGDGKSVTRELSATMKIKSEEQRAEWRDDEFYGEYRDEDVTYEYPPTAEQCRKELFARARPPRRCASERKRPFCAWMVRRNSLTARERVSWRVTGGHNDVTRVFRW
jgi:hypothetical protein